MAEQLLIATLLPAADAEEALTAARCTFDRLVGFGTREPVFDSYATFEQDCPTRAATRWDDLPAATRVDQEPGASFLERQWAETCAAFVENVERVADALVTHSTCELMCDVEHVRHAFQQVGTTEGPTIYLYDEYGLGIRHRNRLDAVLTQDEPVWIVAAVVRY